MINIFLRFVVILILIFPIITLAGNIDSTDKYAWGDRIGWMNFSTTGGNINVTDSALTGHVWSANYGWINLNPTQGGVINNSQGNLSGKAWGEQLGWVNFSGVSINSSGVFTGTATVDNGGQISFGCDNCKVVTTWRPPATGGGGGSSGAGPGPSAVGSSSISLAANLPLEINASGIRKISESLKLIIFGPTVALQPKIIIVPKLAPLALKKIWNLLPERPINRFVFAPLPQELAVVIKKFPELGSTFKSIGVTRLSEAPKLVKVALSLPSLKLPEGIPLADLQPRLKQRIPREIVFVGSGGGKD